MKMAGIIIAAIVISINRLPPVYQPEMSID
jgi:hypothetical protein